MVHDCPETECGLLPKFFTHRVTHTATVVNNFLSSISDACSFVLVGQIIIILIILIIIILLPLLLLIMIICSWLSSRAGALRSPLSSKRSDSLHTCSRGCQSLCSDSMPSFCMTAFHQARTSGHQWNSFYYFHLAFNPRDLYYWGYKK